MVGYRESKYSFNDPMDDWENKMFRGQKADGNRVLKEGYAGLLRDVGEKALLGAKGLYEIGARTLVPWYGTSFEKPKAGMYDNSDDPYAAEKETAARKEREVTRGKGSKGFKPPSEKPKRKAKTPPRP
jgi:hypothetical protein